jgi:hypothetical protein
VTTGAGPEAAATAVLSAARTALGHEVELAGRPEVSVRDGPGAYTCELAGGAGDAAGAAGPGGWDGPLVVRVPPERETGGAAIAREVAWHALGAGNGLRVPDVLSHADGNDGDVGPALVTARGPERSLLECMGYDREQVPRFVALMGELHARLHELPVGSAPAPEGAGAGPLDDLAGLLAASGIAGGHFAAELETLRPYERGGGPPVVCHCGFQLTAIRLDPDDVASALVANWSAARLGEREYDVAQTLLTFWSLPYLAAGRARRQALRTVRDALVEGYRSAYERHAPLDHDRLRYWEAFHALSWSARMAAADGTPASDPWNPAAAISFRESYRKDLTRHFVELTRGGRWPDPPPNATTG